MPDIALRFHKDMLTLSSPVSAEMERQGVDVERDLEFLNLLEPDTVQDIIRMQDMAMATCLTTATEGITRARLMHHNMENHAEGMAKAALEIVNELTPQHVVVEIGPCRLPMDPSSKSSLVEHRDQFADAARLFEGQPFDCFLLSCFTDPSELKCALMGIRKVSDAPVMCSVVVDAEGNLPAGHGTLEDAVAVMDEFGAQVAGIRTAAEPKVACALTKRVADATNLPILVELEVREVNKRQFDATPQNPYYHPDTMMDVALKLRAVGAEILRATGAATPAYTGALAATCMGLNAARFE